MNGSHAARGLGFLLAGLAALALTGCPLPQPLPEYKAGTATPPRIQMDGIPYPDTILRVPAACSTEPTYVLQGITLNDPNTAEQVVARWFVDYDAKDALHYAIQHQDIVPPAESGAADPTRRTVPTYTYAAYAYPDPINSSTPRNAAGVLHVLELVVSAGFDDSGSNPDSPPNRTPATGFETQTYRWVFMTVPAGGDVTCPP